MLGGLVRVGNKRSAKGRHYPLLPVSKRNSDCADAADKFTTILSPALRSDLFEFPLELYRINEAVLHGSELSTH